MDLQLALLYTVEATVAVLERLETVHAEAGLDGKALRALRDDPDWLALRREAGSAGALKVVARGLLERALAQRAAALGD